MTTMPVFVFARRPDIERETGLTLAGQLVVDLPKHRKLKRRQRLMITEIVQRLSAQVRSGQMPADAIVYGWAGGRRPDDAVDVSNHALMEAWAKDRLFIALRIDPRLDGTPRLDSDLMLQLGLVRRQ